MAWLFFLRFLFSFLSSIFFVRQIEKHSLHSEEIRQSYFCLQSLQQARLFFFFSEIIIVR